MADQADQPYVPWTAEEVARLRGNLRRTRLWIVVGVCGVAAVLHFAQRVPLIWTVGYLVLLPWVLWYVTRFVNRLLETGNG